MSSASQVVISCLLICIEIGILTFTLIKEPANSMLDYPTWNQVFLICNTTSLGISAPMGFDYFLIAMCTLYAVKTRNVPENFNVRIRIFLCVVFISLILCFNINTSLHLYHLHISNQEAKFIGFTMYTTIVIWYGRDLECIYLHFFLIKNFSELQGRFFSYLLRLKHQSDLIVSLYIIIR